MPIDLSNYNLDHDQGLWLKTVYELSLAGERADNRIIRSKLWNMISKDFNPELIPYPLRAGNFTSISIPGILLIDPNSDILEKVDKIVFAIRDQLLADNSLNDIDITGLSKDISIEPAEITLFLNLINNVFGEYFQQSKYVNNQPNVFESIAVYNSFNTYYQFDGIEKKIKKFLDDHDTSNKTVKEKSNPVVKTVSQANNNLYFRSDVPQITQMICFVLMPFTQPWSDRVYKELIRENVESLNLQCLRADNLKGQIVIEDIWTQINQAGLIIADVTGRNPNVMYELGIAHAISKPCIHMTQNMNDVPFDFTHLRHYEYEDNTDGFRKFSDELRDVVKIKYKEHYDIDL